MSDKGALLAIGGGVLCCYIMILIIVLLVGIYSRLDPLLYGLRYDAHGYDIYNDQLWTGGRHALGLGLEFIKFPRT